ncbi:MAG TPA: DUF3800 domain-containing protein [Candidatus Kapabacteria bacterium]|nr:DUF3800 domain-containing protein [Candidatus Kapabacteria bacterium]
MYLMYVDESGDTGIAKSPTSYYILSGLVIHELRWFEILDSLIQFRKKLKEEKTLKLREEIHCVKMINAPGELKRIKRNDRIDILKKCIDWINSQDGLNIITVCVNKKKRDKSEEVFELAWKTLIQRLENTINNHNFKGPTNADDKAIIISDKTDYKKIKNLTRKMRKCNYIPNNPFYSDGSRNIILKKIIEDPFMKDSAESFILQIVDVISYCARQIYEPNLAFKKKGGHNFYQRLSDVIVFKATNKNSIGIVEV